MALLFPIAQPVRAGFPAFWDRYPRREAKKDAMKAWNQIVKDAQTEAQIHQALDWQIPHWNALEWYTPPLPATYLRGERFTDEPPMPKTISRPTANVRPSTPAQLSQQDAMRKIQLLMDHGMSRDAAVRKVSIEMGWIKEGQP